jgi:hypothetical protein
MSFPWTDEETKLLKRIANDFPHRYADAYQLEAKKHGFPHRSRKALQVRAEKITRKKRRNWGEWKRSELLIVAKYLDFPLVQATKECLKDGLKRTPSAIHSTYYRLKSGKVIIPPPPYKPKTPKPLQPKLKTPNSKTVTKPVVKPKSYQYDRPENFISLKDQIKRQYATTTSYRD